MKKLVACALVGLGLTQVLTGCGDDDDVPIGTSGSSTNGGKAGNASGGNSTAGSSSGGKAGAATGGVAGKGSGGNATAGSAGKAGSDAGGTGNNAGAGGAGDDGGATGDGGTTGDSVGGAGGAGGAGGGVEPEPQVASPFWLAKFCDAKSKELLMCDNSPEWDICYSTYRPFLSTVGEGFCDGDDENDPVKTLALMDALDKLAAACPSPTVDQWRCTLEGAPLAKAQACRDADDARRVASMTCGL